MIVLSSWVRWLLIGSVGLSVSMYAMDTVRVASTLPVPVQAKESRKSEKAPANAIAKASQMDKVADALAGN